MKVLVTGGGGFLGRGITERLLERGDAVTVLSRGAYPELVERGACVISADLVDAATVAAASAGCDLVYHVAARAGIWGTYADFHRVNVVGTRNVLQALRAQKNPRLIYTSSPSVTFDGQDARNADERLPYPSHFENAYSKTKALAERMVLEAANRGEIAAVALRPHLIWGPRDPHLIPRVVAAARAGRLMQVGDGKNEVDVTYVDNAVDAHILAGDRLAATGGGSPNGRAYFISNGQPVALWPWINALLKRLDVSPVTRSISLSSARRIGGLFEGVYRLLRLRGEPRMTRFLASQLGTSHYYDITAARRDFGYEPRVGVEEGLDRLVAWMKEQGSGTGDRGSGVRGQGSEIGVRGLRNPS